MKRIISLIIALCLILSSFSCAFGADWTSSQISSVVNDVNIISASIDDIFTAFAGQTGIMYNTISEMMSWLTPVGSFNSSDSLTGFTLYEMVDFICYLLGYSGQAAATLYDFIGSIDSTLGSLNSLTTSNNGYLLNLRQALTNYKLGTNSNTGFTNAERVANAHRNLLGSTLNDNNNWTGIYSIDYINPNNYSNSSSIFYWQYGSPLGNIFLLLQYLNRSFVTAFNFEKSAFYTHYNDNLTTWDSQGNTLTQVAFTPESAIQGLYRYLAYTQRDVARLAYVVANDEELEAREKAQTNQSAVVDEFIDPSGSGSISASNFGSLSDVSGEMKTNFSTGQSASGVFNVFDDQHFGYLTQGTADSLDTSGSNTRLLKASGSEYPTPTLDRYYEELNKILEVNTDD